MNLTRSALSAAAALSAACLSAQTAATAPVSDATSGSEVVRMDQFEVATTQGHGYMLPNSAGAFKTNAALLDIPQIDVVITNDLLQDIGFENLTDVLNYFGAYQYFESDNAKIRGGIQTTQQYADDIPVHAGWSDPNTMDSVEIIKGGAEGLYMLNSGLGGIVMRTLKKPLPYAQATAWAWADQWGLFQYGFDATGPIGKIGEVQIDYRVIADMEGGKGYFDNVTDNRKTIAPYFQAKYQNTIVRFHTDLENVVGSQTGLELLNPNGWNLYTGAGRRVSNNPPNNMNRLWTYLYEGSIIQKFSDNWEMRVTGQYFRQGYFGPQVTLTGVNWALGDEYYVNRENDQRWDYWTVISDITGQYNLGPSNWQMKNTDIWGWAFTDQNTQKYIFSTTTVNFSDVSQGIALLPGQPSTSFAVPFGSRAAINATVVPPLNTYYEPSKGVGSHSTIWNGGFYWQHTTEIIPKWLDVTLGESWIDVISDSIADVSVIPWQAQELHASQWVHRIAGVFHLTPEVSIYALSSTNFSPPSTISNFFANGQPNTVPQAGKDNELGMKTALMGGRLSTDFSWFQMVSSNIAATAGFFPNGSAFVTLIGEGVEEGVDGDFALNLLPGWQLIGSFYAGHAADQNNNPISGSWNNAIGGFTRYEFPKASALHGLSFGGGMNRLGSRWVSISSAVQGLPAGFLPANGLVKAADGTMMNAFVQYTFNKHILLNVSCANVLDDAFAITAGATSSDPSPPRTFRFEGKYKF